MKHYTKGRGMPWRWVVPGVYISALLPADGVRADQIVTGGVNYTGAKIVSLEQSQLAFRSSDGTLHRAWLDQIATIFVDRGGAFDDFNQAERFLAGGEAKRAIVRYRRARRMTESFWPDLIAARLLLACDAAEQLDNATGNFIQVVRSRWLGPAAAARLMPGALPARTDGKTARALDQLRGAIGKSSGEAHIALLRLFRYDILRTVGDDRAGPVALEIAGLSIPPEARSERVFAIKLHALREALRSDSGTAALSSLDEAIRDCPDSILPDFLLLKGRTLSRSASSRQDLIRASWAFMRVAIHFPREPRGAEGLYETALLLERIGRTEKAAELLRECLKHKHSPQQTRQLAEEALARLITPGKSAG